MKPPQYWRQTSTAGWTHDKRNFIWLEQTWYFLYFEKSIVLGLTIDTRYRNTVAKYEGVHFIVGFVRKGLKEGAWPSGQRVGLAIRWSPVRVPLWPLAGFVRGRRKLRSSAMLVNSQLVVSCQLGSLNRYVAFDLFVSKHFSDTQLRSHYSNICLSLFQCCFVMVFRWERKKEVEQNMSTLFLQLTQVLMS